MPEQEIIELLKAIKPLVQPFRLEDFVFHPQEKQALRAVDRILRSVNYDLEIIFKAKWTFLEINVLAEKLDYYSSYRRKVS